MASCFFCGAAGPETIIEVNFKEKPPFRTDQIVTVTGILELNRNNVDHCNYILKAATGQLIN
ncbi:homoserine dehydrogenase [Flagellimonas sp. 389]|nr:homoserine dehydrogenase [Flagellimonas sp. 389]